MKCTIKNVIWLLMFKNQTYEPGKIIEDVCWFPYELLHFIYGKGGLYLSSVNSS